jgi:hypothetical protein
MRQADEQALFAICARLELESNNLRKIAKGKHLKEEEKNLLEYYARKQDSLRRDMKRNFPSAF